MCVQKVMIGLLLVVVITGCGLNDKKIVSERYPSMKWGFTTQNFINTTPVSVDNANAFIAYARTEGYDWIELRDPEASLTVSQCQKIASFARDNQIEIIYSIQRGLLDDDFWDIFKRGIANAAVFNGPPIFRMLTTGKEFDEDPSKLSWTQAEFEQAVLIANQAAAIAKNHGIHLALENSNGDIDGLGKGYYGLKEFFDTVNPEVLWQFDTANFFWVPRVVITSQQVESFTQKYASRIAYVHLKSARNHKALAVLNGNPLDFESILSILDEHEVQYIAIELDAIKDPRQIYKNLTASVDYLIRKNYVFVK